MYQAEYLVTINEICETSISLVKARLSEIGMHTECTFDLQTAREAHIGCACPHHGTGKCDCQIVVLLVYSQRNGPITLVAHSQDGKTRFGLVNQLKGGKLEYLEKLIREHIITRAFSIINEEASAKS